MSITTTPVNRQTIAYGDRPLGTVRRSRDGSLTVYATLDFNQFLQRLAQASGATISNVATVVSATETVMGQVGSIDTEIGSIEASIGSIEAELAGLDVVGMPSSPPPLVIDPSPPPWASPQAINGGAILLEQQASAVPISQLPVGAAMDGSELLAVVQGGLTKQETADAAAFLILTNGYAVNPLDATVAGSDGTQLTIHGGAGLGTGNGGRANFTAGSAGAGGGGAGGSVVVQGGNGDTAGAGGLAQISGGNSGNAGAGAGGDVHLDGGTALGTGNGGTIRVRPGIPNNVAGLMGNVTVDVTKRGPAAANGFLEVVGLDTTDPATATAAWNDNGVVALSGNPVHGATVVGSGSAVALTTGTAVDVATLTVTNAGVYRVSGAVYFTGAAATTITRCAGSVGTVVNTLDTTAGRFGNQYLAGAAVSAIGQDVAVTGFETILSLAAGATVHLCAQADFAVSTLSAYGQIMAVPVL